MNPRAPGLCTVDFGIDATSSAKRLQEEYTGRAGGERSGVIRSEDDLLVHGSRRWRRKGGGVGGLEVRGGWEAVVHGWVARGVHQYRARPGHTGGTGMALHNLSSGQGGVTQPGGRSWPWRPGPGTGTSRCSPAPGPEGTNVYGTTRES